MTAVEIPVEKWPGAVREVTLGSSYGGGTRTSTVTVGGETALPFLGFEGALPHRPALAVEVVDMEPGDWSPELVATLVEKLRRPPSDDFRLLVLLPAKPSSGPMTHAASSVC